jgi:hypothetical protein
MNYDDATLMSYVDGELDAQTASAIRAQIAADADLQHRVQAFRRSAEQAKQHFNAQLETPVPAALLASVQQSIAQAQAQASANANIPSLKRVSGATAAERSFIGWAANEPRYAMAASLFVLALCVSSFFAGGMLNTGTTQTASYNGVVLSSVLPDAVAQVLSTAPSGERWPLGDTAQGASVQVLASFRDRNGALCREFGLEQAGAAPKQGVACRERQAWATRFIAAIPATGAVYTPASGHAAVDSYLSMIGASEPLNTQDEKKALESLKP